MTDTDLRPAQILGTYSRVLPGSRKQAHEFRARRRNSGNVGRRARQSKTGQNRSLRPPNHAHSMGGERICLPVMLDYNIMIFETD